MIYTARYKMNLYIEQTVHRQHDAETFVRRVLIILAAVTVPVVIALIGLITEVYYCFVLAGFSVLLCIYGVWYFWTSLNVDYEYSLAPGELTVSRITDNRKRKDIVNIDLSNVIGLDIYDPPRHNNQAYGRVYKCCKSIDGCHALIFRPSSKSEKEMLLFSPNKELSETIGRLSIKNVK